MRIVTTTHIACPIEKAFDYLTNPGNWPRWHPSTVSVTGAIHHSLHVGEQVHEEYIVAGQKGRATWTVRERHEPHRWVFDTVAENGHHATISYIFTSEGAGTRFQRELEIIFPASVPADVQAEFERKVEAESAEALRRVAAILQHEHS
jgi:uncharacterized protein YndB with AHSA1/START domain